MKYNFKRFFSVAALLCSSAAAVADNCAPCSTCPTTCPKGQNLAQVHSFGASASRGMILKEAAFRPMPDEEGWHGTFGVGFEYQRSFKKCDTTGCCTNWGSLPFWAQDGTNMMTVGGNTGGYDLDAYQLGMGAVTTNGSVALNPSMFQTGGDFLLYVGSHKTERGFFFSVHAPVGVISINPNLRFADSVEAVNYPAGALNNVAATTVAAPYENIQQAFAGGKGAGYLKPMVTGLIDCKRTSSARFGDIEFAVGYNVYADENKHLGIAAYFSAPTGNKAEGVYVLEPIFGRNGHAGAGGEIIGHWKFYESDDSDKWAQVFMDGWAMHLFNSKHIRSFDLKNNGAGSKYMLLAKYADLATLAPFQNEIINAVNITTVGVKSTFAVEGNFAVGFDFHWKNWSLQVGYEGWGRSCEKLCLDCACPGSTNFNQYAVLGRQTPFTAAGAVLDLCEPAATVGTSQARAAVATATILNATTGANRLPADATEALDVEGQRARSTYTNKPFVQAQYTWTDSDYAPYLGFAGGAEIPSGKFKNQSPKLWNVGIQGGIAF